MKPHIFGARFHHQSGISLMVVMVIILLTTLLAIGGARTAFLNESLTGNLTDQQRAFTSAEILLRDAQETVMLHLRQTGADKAADFLPNANGRGFLPQSLYDYGQFIDAIEGAGSNGIPCVRGYCTFTPDASKPVGAWWNDSASLESMWSSGASYGQYTGITIPTGNRVLQNGRFWIEVYHYSKSVGGHQHSPDDRHPFVYQLTSVVPGLKPSTLVVLRSIVVPSSAP